MKEFVNVGTIGHADYKKNVRLELLDALDIVSKEAKSAVITISAFSIEIDNLYTLQKKNYANDPWRKENKRPGKSQAKKRKAARRK